LLYAYPDDWTEHGSHVLFGIWEKNSIEDENSLPYNKKLAIMKMLRTYIPAFYSFLERKLWIHLRV
jgi:3-deoxy-D-manno-octulosonic-acid transferase